MSELYPDYGYIRGSMSGVRLTIGQAKKAKSNGLESGYPDISWHYKRFKSNGVGEYTGLYIELKKADGVPSNISDNQVKWLSWLEDQGGFCVVCFGYEAAIQVTDWYYNDACLLKLKPVERSGKRILTLK